MSTHYRNLAVFFSISVSEHVLSFFSTIATSINSSICELQKGPANDIPIKRVRNDWVSRVRKAWCVRVLLWINQVGFSDSSACTESYDQIGKNVIFQAMPPVVIFDDFRVDEWVSAKLKVTNISTTSQRMNILPPESAFFRMRVDKKVL
jgi:hypothetical protein